MQVCTAESLNNYMYDTTIVHKEEEVQQVYNLIRFVIGYICVLCYRLSLIFSVPKATLNLKNIYFLKAS